VCCDAVESATAFYYAIKEVEEDVRLSGGTSYEWCTNKERMNERRSQDLFRLNLHNSFDGFWWWWHQ
jgi:hypothetical protein